MGAAVYLKLENPEAAREHVSAVDGKGVAKDWESLNDFAERHSLTPLHEFLSMGQDDLSNLLGGDTLAENSAVIPPEKWFEASDGLTAIERLLQRIQSGGFALSDAALQDLDSYRKVLREAADHGSRFHFAFDF